MIKHYSPFDKYLWGEEYVETLKQMAKSGASLIEICRVLPKYKKYDLDGTLLMARHISVLNTGKMSNFNEEKREDKSKSFSEIYAERGRKWEPMDDLKLKRLFLQRYSEDEISYELQRSITAIQKRIAILYPSYLDKCKLFDQIRPYINMVEIEE